MLCTTPGAWRPLVTPDWLSVDDNVNSTSCPRFRARHDRYSSPDAQKAGCCFKAPQQRWLSRNRFVPCDNATLGAASMLRALHGKSMALIGDSVTHQLWDALTAAIFESGLEVRVTWRPRSELLLPRHVRADDVCSLAPVGAPRGGSELNFSLKPVPPSGPKQGMGVRCTLQGRQGGSAQQGWLLRPVCAHAPDEELYVPSAGARLSWWRIKYLDLGL